MISELTPQQQVAATSDRFFRRFVDIWIVFAVVLWIFLSLTMPHVQYSSYAMFAAGLPAKIAIHMGRMRLARYLLLAPMCVCPAYAPVRQRRSHTGVGQHSGHFVVCRLDAGATPDGDSGAGVCVKHRWLLVG